MNHPRLHATPRRLELQIESDPAAIAPTRKAIEAFVAECGFDDRAQSEVGLALNEALANVMRHAYRGAKDRPIAVQAEFQSEILQITLRDWGNGVNPTTLPAKPRDPRTPGGIGMLCLYELMDKVLFSPQGDGMLLTLVRHKRRPARQQSARRTA